MGKKRMATRNRDARKRRKFSFRNLPDGAKSPTDVVADYIFGDEHSESSVSWLMRKLDRYKNDSSFTSDVYTGGEEGNDTATSRLQTDICEKTEGHPACKKVILEEKSEDATCNESVDQTPSVDDFMCKCEGRCVWEGSPSRSGSPSGSGSPTYQISALKSSSPSTSFNPGSKN